MDSRQCKCNSINYLLPNDFRIGRILFYCYGICVWFTANGQQILLNIQWDDRTFAGIICLPWQSRVHALMRSSRCSRSLTLGIGSRHTESTHTPIVNAKQWHSWDNFGIIVSPAMDDCMEQLRTAKICTIWTINQKQHFHEQQEFVTIETNDCCLVLNDKMSRRTIIILCFNQQQQQQQLTYITSGHTMSN